MRFDIGALLAKVAIERKYVIGNVERRLGRPAEAFFRLPRVVRPEWLAVRLERILSGRSVANVRAYCDQRRTIGNVLRDVDRLRDRVRIVAVSGVDELRMPAGGVEARGRVVGERYVSGSG